MKHPVLPNNMSPNRTTRLHEEIYVFCRESEFKTFNTNKKVKSYRMTGQPNYTNINNVIYAFIRDKGVKTFNHNVFSTELVEELLHMYVKEKNIVLDPFTGSGSVVVACTKYKCKWIGSEIDKTQVEYAMMRVLEKRKEMRKKKIINK